MDRLPVEILTGIAAALSSTRDVCNFRLCSPRCSSAGFPILFRQVHVMNTIDCLEEANTLHASSAGSSRVTKHLTIHHGTWPAAESLRIWSTHPLRNGHAAESVLGMTCAFRDYRAFVQREASRTGSSDADRFVALFELFPNVNSVTISHVHHWDKGKLTNAQFTRLTSNFRIVPRFEGCVNSAVSSILPALQRRPLVRDVTIRGLFDPSTTKCVDLPSVTRLCIQSLTYPARCEDIRQFLAAFPSLEELDLRGNSAGPLFGQGLPLQGVQCPKLARVEFTNFCTSEDELVDFVQQHEHLRLFVLEKVVLYMGSWKSFFARVHGRPAYPDIRLGDTLCLSSFPPAFENTWPYGPGAMLGRETSQLLAGQDAQGDLALEQQCHQFMFQAHRPHIKSAVIVLHVVPGGVSTAYHALRSASSLRAILMVGMEEGRVNDYSA